MNEGCQRRRTGDTWSRSYCGKSPTEVVDGEQLCKRHASAKRAAATAKAKRYEAYEKQEAITAQWKQRMKNAADALGIKAWLSYSLAARNVTDSVVISLTDFEQLAARLNKEN